MILHLSQREPAGSASYEQQARHLLQRALEENPNLEQARDLLTRLDSPNGSAGIVELGFVDPGH